MIAPLHPAGKNGSPRLTVPPAAKAKPTKRTPPQGPIERQNALLHSGWLRVLRPMHVLVWFVYHCHADRDGLAFPGAALVARTIGHVGTQHVQKARAELLRFGLLVAVEEGGGNRRGTYRVTVPEVPSPLPESRPPPKSGGSPNREGDRPRNRE